MVDAQKFCEEVFPTVSRTFAVNVVKLSPPLRFRVLISYLLCRIADTIEDDPDLVPADKDNMLLEFASLLEHQQDWRRDCEKFTTVCQQKFDSKRSDGFIAQNSHYVLECFFAFPVPVQHHIAKWVREMAEGMGQYALRKQSETQVTFLTSLDDLEKYCYYVAGTVGHLLTGLFSQQYSFIDKEFLESKSTSFGLGLQLTNIIKDSVVDYQRGWCYLPQDLLDEVGLATNNFFLSQNRFLAHEVMGKIIARAQHHLDNALAYSCKLPRRTLKVRVFCFLPLMMAIKTLEHAAFNEQLFEPQNPVKISRNEVMQIVEYTRSNVWSNSRMCRWYSRVAKSLENKMTRNDLCQV